ncbi:MAG: hypothetical protein ABR591_15295 [Candidatus Velthaea sp.]
MEELTLFGVTTSPNQAARARFRTRLRRIVDEVLACHTTVGETLAADLVRALEHDLGQPAELPGPAVRAALIEEANGHPVCWVCEYPIRLDARDDANDAFAIDHVVRRGKGLRRGEQASVAAAHRICNAFRAEVQPSERYRARYEAFLNRMRRKSGLQPAS